jgi:hypothetical protein
MIKTDLEPANVSIEPLCLQMTLPVFKDIESPKAIESPQAIIHAQQVLIAEDEAVLSFDQQLSYRETLPSARFSYQP